MIILQTSNQSGLHRALVRAIDTVEYKKQREHRLLILSCYIDFDAIKKLINLVSDCVRLARVGLMFEFLEAFRSRLPNETLLGLENLKAWCKTKQIEFFWYPVRAGALMHAKGYALVQRQGSSNGSGVVCIGSGNATMPGLGLSTSYRVNIEIASISTSDRDLTEFISCWNRLIKDKKDLSDASKREDFYGFSYALLASGIFLHDWRDSIAAQIGIKYTLTSKGRKQLALNDPELRSLGFQAEQATISGNPFSGVKFPASRMLPKEFSKNYTIDTLLGRWCPRSVWDVVERTIGRDENFTRFLSSFRKATSEKNLPELAKVEEAKSKRLTRRGVVTHDPERVSRWQRKVQALRDNEKKLARIFMKLEPFDLPYDYKARLEVEELKDSLVQTMAVKSRRSLVSRKIAEADELGDLLALELTEAERIKLENMILPQAAK